MESTITRRLLAGSLGSALAFGLALAGCGSNGAAGTSGNASLTGHVAGDALTSATVSLIDSSAEVQERTATVDATGAFALDVSGLTPPYLVRADAQDADGAVKLYAFAEDAGVANVNAVTTAAVHGAAGDDAEQEHEQSDGDGRHRTATSFRALLQQLQTVLAPLFELYGVPADPFTRDGADAQLRAMLKDVAFRVHEGTLVVTNRATGGVIFTGPLSNLASGTFNQANLPGTPQPPAATCTAFTYGAWTPSTCPSSGVQTRTVASATPAGCTGGSPVLTQTCTPPPPPPPATCTSFTYSAWAPSTCPSSGVQTRTVASATPAGCTGGSPVLTQTCTPPPPPPPATCTSFTYSAWAPATCPSSGRQTRTVASASPAGCTGGSPVLTQTCTPPPPPPPATCTSFTYSAWAPATCPSSGQQTRTVASASPAGCTGGSPVLTQTCTPPPPPPVTCTSFTYSAWAPATCPSSGQQTRTVASASPAGCTGGTPVLTQACTPAPTYDGAALYTQSCSSCHGPLATSNLKGKGISVTSIKSRGMTQGLSDAQLQAIVNAVGP